MCLLSGQNVWVSLLAALVAGLATGFVTGLLHTFMGIPAILAGILCFILALVAWRYRDTPTMRSVVTNSPSAPASRVWCTATSAISRS